jgi:hypothetical protein
MIWDENHLGDWRSRLSLVLELFPAQSLFRGIFQPMKCVGEFRTDISSLRKT